MCSRAHPLCLYLCSTSPHSFVSHRTHGVANKREQTSWFSSLSTWVKGKAITAAIQYGIDNEPNALAAYKVYLAGQAKKDSKGLRKKRKTKGKTKRKSTKGATQSEFDEVHQTGTWIDKEHPFMSASPDGLVGNEGTVEIKCQYLTHSLRVFFIA